MKLHLSSSLLAVLLVLFASTAVVAQTSDLRPLFPSRAGIHASAGRLARVELPPEVLSACRGDLSDLRIIDADGREIPYRLDSDPAADAERTVVRGFPAELLDVDRTTVARDAAPPLRREVYELAAPRQPSRTGSWDLVFGSDRPRFVRRVSVQARRDDGRPLFERQGSVFRLDSPGREKTRLTIADADSLVRVVVTLEGEESFFLEPSFRFEESLTLPDERIAVDLIEVGRKDLPGRTIIELNRPRGLIPAAIGIVTSTPAFHRTVEVEDRGPGIADSSLGRGTLYRVPGFTTAEELELALRAARGGRLFVAVDNADSPPLEDLHFKAILGRPALVFALRGGGPGEASATLYFGGGRVHRPRYDLQGMGELETPTGASDAGYETARLGPVESNSLFNAGPVLSFAMHPGAEIDSREFTHRRVIHADPSAEGLSRLRLELSDLARLREDLADLRIVDDASRQWAYLVARDAGHQLLPLGIDPREAVGTGSRYSLFPPAMPATLDRITLRTDVAYVDRAYQLFAKVNDHLALLKAGRLSRPVMGEPAVPTGPAEIEIEFPPLRVNSLELVIEDGNDAPLAFSEVGGRFPVTDIYFAAPRGKYYLLAGHPEATFPRYELARVKDLVLAVAAGEAAAGPLVENEIYSAAARLTSGSALQRLALWIALGLAVVFLVGLTLRLAHREPTR